MILKLGAKEWFALVIAIILITDIAILLDVPILRVIFGFLCYTLLPGALILYILKLNKIGIVEKIVLSVGLSVSFLMLFGLLIDKLYFSLGYAMPLSTLSLVVTFSVTMILFCTIAYKINKGVLSFVIPDLNLSKSEKVFLIMPILFPALSIFGMHVMNTTDNNIILMFLLFLIPIYVIFVCFFNHKFPKRMYPVVIFLISISLLLLWSLRSNHIIGMDVHAEYYHFQTIFSNLHWDIFGHSTFDACLAISLLPSIYQSFLNVNGEYLYKILYTLLFSIAPLIVFVISKKYVDELYAFLASFFFMSQHLFIRAGVNPRTSTAILFFALAMMVFLSDGIDPLKKRILFIVFMASCIVSHYSTTYIFFFIMLFSWFSIEMLAKRFTLKKSISLTMVLLFFGIIFFWYSQVTEAAFNAGVGFVEKTFLNLHNFFIMESRCERTGSVLGEGIVYKGIPHKIEFVFTWLTFVLIGVGVVSMLKKYKEMVVIPGIKHLKPDFLKTKISIEYLVLTLACAGLLVIMVALPYISAGYDIKRLYTMMTVILSVVFVLGGIMLLKYLDQAFAVIRSKGKALKENTPHNHFRKYFFFLVKVFTKPLQGLRGRGAEPRKGKKVVGKAFFSKETFMTHGDTHEHENNKVFSYQRFDGKNTSEVRAYLIILLVLIPYFMCTTGPMYQIFGVPREMTINSDGHQYGALYIHGQDWYAGEWMGRCVAQNNLRIYTDRYGGVMLANHNISLRSASFIDIEYEKINGYIYLRYYNLINKKLQGASMMEYHLTDYSDIFAEKSRIYNNGGSEVWE